MTLNGWVLAPVFFYLAFWAVNPLRLRLPFLRKLIHRPVPTTFHGHTLAELLSLSPSEANTDDDDDDPAWTLEWHLLGPRISTTAFNDLPVRLVRQLSPVHCRTLARIYDLGLVWGALGLLICVWILLWEAGGTASWLSGVLRSGNGGRASAQAGSQTVGGPGWKRSVIQPLVRSFLCLCLLREQRIDACGLTVLDSGLDSALVARTHARRRVPRRPDGA